MSRSIAQREDIRDLILDGVDVLLARYGYRKMTMEDLAKQVGIGKGTIYLHFRSKQEVTLSHINRIVERLVEQLQGIASQKQDSISRLQQMLELRVMYRFDSVQHYSESLNELLSDLRAPFLAERTKHFDLETTVFASVIKEGKAKGEIDIWNPRETAVVLLLATNALLPYSLSKTELGSRDEVAQRVRKIAQTLLYGIAHKSNSRRSTQL